VHETGMFRDLLRKIEEVADLERARRVTRVRLWVGALSHLTAAQLREQWPTVTRGTVAEGAALEVAVSRDPADPRAQGVVLTSVDVDPSPAPGARGRGPRSAGGGAAGSQGLTAG
jgi:hydrogenase nickel incorporation protein HypA/HybF